MNTRSSFLTKLSWVDWLAVFLVALGIFLALSIFWLPNLLARWLGLGGGWYGVLPLLLIAASVAMLVRQSAVCPVADKLLRFPPETETCTFVAPVLFPSLLFWSMVFAIRSWQLLRH
jgi:hypothetical protein